MAPWVPAKRDLPRCRALLLATVRRVPSGVTWCEARPEFHRCLFPSDRRQRRVSAWSPASERVNRSDPIHPTLTSNGLISPRRRSAASTSSTRDRASTSRRRRIVRTEHPSRNASPDESNPLARAASYRATFRRRHVRQRHFNRASARRWRWNRSPVLNVTAERSKQTILRFRKGVILRRPFGQRFGDVWERRNDGTRMSFKAHRICQMHETNHQPVSVVWNLPVRLIANVWNIMSNRARPLRL